MRRILIATASLLIMAGASATTAAPALARSSGHSMSSHAASGTRSSDTGARKTGLVNNGVASTVGSEPDSIDKQTECYTYSKVC